MLLSLLRRNISCNSSSARCKGTGGGGGGECTNVACGGVRSAAERASALPPERPTERRPNDRARFVDRQRSSAAPAAAGRRPLPFSCFLLHQPTGNRVDALSSMSGLVRLKIKLEKCRPGLARTPGCHPTQTRGPNLPPASRFPKPNDVDPTRALLLNPAYLCMHNPAP